MIVNELGPTVTYIAPVGTERQLVIGWTALNNPHSNVKDSIAKVPSDWDGNQLIMRRLTELVSDEPLTGANAKALLDLAATSVELDQAS